MHFVRTAFFGCFLILLASCKGAEKHVAEAEVKALLDKYFTTWSAQDMAGYGACFHPNARVTFLDGKTGESMTQGLTDFVHSQKMAHAQFDGKMYEVPTSIELIGDAAVTQAHVRWKLTRGATIVTGADYFTLIKAPEGWRIMSLVFYND